MATDLAKLVVRLEAQIAEYQVNLEKAQRQLSKFDKQSSVSARSIGKGLAAAASIAAGALAALSVKALKSQDDLFKMSQMTGVSTESLSQLQYAAKLAGIESDQFGSVLAKLAKSAAAAATGGEAQADAFAKIGVKVRDANGEVKDADALLLEVADKFSTLKDGVLKTALAQEIFGKSGAKLIPLLNSGKAGIEAMKKEADAFGLTVRDDAAAAAEQFNDSLEKVKQASSGIVNQVTQALLPTFNALSDELLESVKSGTLFDAMISTLTFTLKGLVTGGVIVTSVLEQLGTVIGGTAAALVAAASGEFGQAASIIKSAFSDASANVTDDIEFIVKVWDDAVPKLEKAAKDTDDALKKSIVFNPDKAAAEAQKAADAALSEITKMVAGLQQQADTYGMSEAAVIRYRIAVGDLAESFATAGAAADPLKSQLIGLTERIEAANAATAEQLAKEQELQAIRSEGAQLTESLRTPAEEYADTLIRLNTLLEQNAISQETYNRGIAKAQEGYAAAQEKGNAFLEQASKNTQDIIADALTNGFQDGAKGMLRTFVGMLLKMQAQALAAKIASAIFGSGGVGSGGGLVGMAAAAFGGSRDSGGRGETGKAYMIGTGAQPEMFVPDQPGTFTPASDMRPQITVRPQVINVQDPSEIPTAMQSSRGEEAIINVINRNQGAIRSLLQGA